MRAVRLVVIGIFLLSLVLSTAAYASSLDVGKPYKGEVESSPIFGLALQNALNGFERQATPKIDRTPIESPAAQPTFDCWPTMNPNDPACSTIDPNDPACSTMDPWDPACSTIQPWDPACSTIDPNDPACSTIDPYDPNCQTTMDPWDPVCLTIDPNCEPTTNPLDPMCAWTMDPNDPACSTIDPNDPMCQVNSPPDCSEADADPACLWPPNHEFVNISITGVTDPDGDPVAFTIIAITSDEPTASDEGSGGANHAPDADGVSTNTARVRAECSGNGDGRVYEIWFIASDDKGGECECSVMVRVPHDQSDKDCPAIDSGQIYDATQIN